MLGAIVGDIIGSRFEFNNYRDTDFELFTDQCEFTDDTICTAAVADALINNKPFDESLQYWCRKYPNPKGGYGGRFTRWIQSDNPQPYFSYGNGSAMRVSPCAWFSEELYLVLEDAERSAVCTHNHPFGITGAKAVAECIFQAKKGAFQEKIKKIIEDKYGYDLSQDIDTIRKNNTFDETCQVTVPQAIIAFLESNDFEHAIRLAVSIGGDSDTIAAITGSIAEAYYLVPSHIKDKAMEYLPDEIQELIKTFYHKIDRAIYLE